MGNNRQAFIRLLFSLDVGGGEAYHPPRDPGGLVNHGIPKAALEEWRAPKPVSDDDVRSLSLREAEDIIWLRYWNPLRANDLVSGVDVYLCDFAINSGRRNSVKTLQQAVLGFHGKDADGIIGPKSLQAVAARDPAELLSALHQARISYLRKLPTWSTFGASWTERCKILFDFAHDRLPEQAPAEVARTDKIKRNVIAYGATALTGLPLVVSALPAAKGAYAQVEAALGPFAEVIPWLKYVVGGGVMIGIIWLSVRNATMAHNAKVTGSQAAIVAESRIAQEAVT